MKNKNVYIIIFSFIIISFIAFFVYSTPTYVHLKALGWSGPKDDILWCISDFFRSSELLYNYYCHLRNKTSINMIIIALVVNMANMIFGFINYKKKWWYYLILVITIIMSIMLWDCFQILIHEDDMV